MIIKYVMFIVSARNVPFMYAGLQ